MSTQTCYTESPIVYIFKWNLGDQNHLRELQIRESGVYTSSMKLFRFSPIKSEEELFEAIKHIHFVGHRMCKQILGHLLPVAGNIGVFCHYDDEFKFLTEIRKKLTDIDDNWNQKYFRLYKPIVIPAKNEIPKTTYTYLYVRRPEVEHPHVGDVDFYIEPKKYKKLKQSVKSGKASKGIKIFERPDLDLLRLYDPDTDVSAFIGSEKMSEIVDKNQIK